MAEAKIEILLSNGARAGDTLKELTKQANALNKQIKDLNPNSAEFAAKAKDLQAVNSKMSEIKNQIKGTTTASNALKQQFGGILNQIPGFSQLSGAINSAKGGVGGLTSGFGLLKGAIIATGIGALIIAVTTLVGWFTKTEKGANMLSGAFKAMSAVVDTLMNRLWNIRTTLKDLFTNPVAFFKNLGEDIKQAAVEGYDLVQVFDDIEDRQRELSVKMAENDVKIDQLILQSKNAGKTFQDKLAILAQAEKITRESYTEQLNLSKEYLAAVQREVDAAEKQGVLGDELADKLADAKKEYFKVLGEETQILTKIDNFKEKIFDKQEKADIKAADRKEKDLEKQEKDQIESLKKLEDLRVESIKNSEQREIEALNLKFQRELDELTLQGDELREAEKLIEEVRAREIQEIKDKYALEAAEKDKKNKSDQEARDLEASEKAKQIAKDEADFARMMDDTKRSIALDSLAFGKEIVGKKSKDAEAAKKIIKVLSVAELGINLQRELSANAVVAAANPLNTVTYGAAGKSQLVLSNALSYLRFGFGVARVLAFRKGGYVEGPSHEQGGIKGIIKSSGTPFEFEGGEFFFSREATSALGKERLAALNNFFTRANGGPVTPPQLARTAAANSGTTGGSQLIDLTPVVNEIRALTKAMDERIDRLEVINDVSKTKRGIQVLNKLAADASV